MNSTINGQEVKATQTVEEYEALLEAYKIKNPAKYAKKLASGEFDKYKKKLDGAEKPAAKPAKAK